MKVASGLAFGHQPLPELARDAVGEALAAADLTSASHVLLLLSRDFAHAPQPAVLAAARAAGCLSVAGGTASGLFTERGWQLDQPAAAALVLADMGAEAGDAPRLSFSGQPRLPFQWLAGSRRAGLIDNGAAAWAHGRVTGDACAELPLPGLRSRLAISTGLRCLAPPQPAEQSQGYELLRVGSQSARDSLLRALPGELREHLPLHQIAVVCQPDEPAINILSVNADGSLLLSEALPEGTPLQWAIRQPLAAAQQMRDSLAAIAEPGRRPDFALMFSCIGRGPLFYGDDDLDITAFREAFPGVPLLGAYGSGQIAPLSGGNRLFHNTALTLLFESSHV